jgi:hypothetical protein
VAPKNQPSGARKNDLLHPLTAALLAVPLLVALAATGGLSYAASSVHGAVAAVRAAATTKQTFTVLRLTSGHDQYQPGYGFGDPNHTHAGSPGLFWGGRHPGHPPSGLMAHRTRDGLGATVSGKIVVDEQVHFYISVDTATGVPILLTQQSVRGGSRVGNPVTGPQTKFIQYTVLIPRAIPFTLRIPVNLLEPGAVYRVHFSATAPNGNKASLSIPFAA